MSDILFGSLEDGAIRSELHPDLEFVKSLDISKCWVKLHIRFEIVGKVELKLHGVASTVVQHNFLSERLLVH